MSPSVSPIRGSTRHRYLLQPERHDPPRFRNERDPRLGFAEKSPSPRHENLGPAALLRSSEHSARALSR
jgi:hypothetical protein